MVILTMRLIFISLNMLFILPYFDMAMASEKNSSSDEFIDPTRLNEVTKNFKDTELKHLDVENDISVKVTKLDEIADYTANDSSGNLTTNFDNSTESDKNEIDNIHSSFNLAIIPAAAVFVFVIIICFKCCKWFRQYTRGDDKENNFYAVIITDDDEEHVDITSDTASTVCYDTVSSNGSFLKRSGNDSSFSSIKFWRQGSFKGDKGLSQNTENVKKASTGKQDLVRCTPLCNTRTRANQSFAEPDFRVSSTSSAETISEQINDSPTIRRNNRFRVSFVTETMHSRANASPSEMRPTPSNNFKRENPMRSSLKKSAARTISNEMPFLVPKSAPERGLDERIKMKSVGTQTNKTFRNSLRKSKGHVSDTDIDDRFFSGLGEGTLALTSGQIRNNDVDKSGETANTLTIHTKHSSFSTPDERNISLSTVIPEISIYQFDTKVDVINNQNSQADESMDLELDDDVFEEDMCNESLSQTENPNMKTSCEPIERNGDENTIDETNHSENVSCNECNDHENTDIIESNCDNIFLNVQDKESSGLQILCNKCRTEYEDIPASDGGKTEGTRVQHSYKPSEVHSRHSSTLSLESSGYAELSSNESCSSSPMLTHRV